MRLTCSVILCRQIKSLFFGFSWHYPIMLLLSHLHLLYKLLRTNWLIIFKYRRKVLRLTCNTLCFTLGFYLKVDSISSLCILDQNCGARKIAFFNKIFRLTWNTALFYVSALFWILFKHLNYSLKHIFIIR